MNADSTFIIGAMHTVCQDYAVSGSGLPGQQAMDTRLLPATPYVVLSDGCSSSPDTDIGARLLVKSAETVFHNSLNPSADALAESHKESARRALAWAALMGLPSQAVDATLLTLHLKDDELIAGCSGDGVVVLESRAGSLDVYAISYPSGYPLYPGYAHQPERRRALEEQDGFGKEVKHFSCASFEEPLLLQGASTSTSVTEVLAVKASDYKLAVILSDGINSFCAIRQTDTSKRVESIHLAETLKELVSFKSVRGSFVGRRVKRMAKDYLAKGWQHMDDLAVGALYLED
jgi:hypothetical protein